MPSATYIVLIKRDVLDPSCVTAKLTKGWWDTAARSTLSRQVASTTVILEKADEGVAIATMLRELAHALEDGLA